MKARVSLTTIIKQQVEHRGIAREVVVKLLHLLEDNSGQNSLLSRKAKRRPTSVLLLNNMLWAGVAGALPLLRCTQAFIL